MQSSDSNESFLNRIRKKYIKKKWQKLANLRINVTLQRRITSQEK